MGENIKTDTVKAIETIKKVFAVTFMAIPFLIHIIKWSDLPDTQQGCFEKILSEMNPDLIWELLPMIASQLICAEIYETKSLEKFFIASLSVLIIEIVLYALLQFHEIKYASTLIFVIVATSLIWIFALFLIRLIIGIKNRKRVNIDNDNNNGLSGDDCSYSDEHKMI